MKVGDKVKVVARRTGHKFDIGEIVTCIVADDPKMSDNRDMGGGFVRDDETEVNQGWMQPEEYVLVANSTSEVRVTSSTGGQKGTKPARHGLIPFLALDTLAKVYGMGAAKYDDNNWRKGYNWSLCYDAMQRHLLAFWSGEELDPESQLPHLGHAMWHCAALLEFSQSGNPVYKQFDSRYKEST